LRSSAACQLARFSWPDTHSGEDAIVRIDDNSFALMQAGSDCDKTTGAAKEPNLADLRTSFLHDIDIPLIPRGEKEPRP
jgi:hypothetical protein